MILAIFGPTASGKSSLGLRFAKDLNGEIVNCDSVQLFEGFRIGAAQPSDEEKSQALHHLYEVISPEEAMSVGRYQKLAKKVINEIKTTGKLPIVVGGTSLYLTALLYGLADIEQDDDIREELEGIPNEDLYEELSKKDPESLKKIHANDRQRLLRAVESVRTGKKISESHAEHQDLPIEQDCLIIVPVWERKALYDRIDKRTQIMFDSGVVEEAKELARRFPTAEALGSIGYKEVLAANREEITEWEEVQQKVAQNTRRFAKRQLTWLRNEPQKRNWVIRPDDALGDAKIEIVGDLEAFPKPKNLKHLECLDWDYPRVRDEVAKFVKNREQKGVFIWFVPAHKVV